METTLLFKTMIILTFELSIAFGLCIYSLKAAKRAALSGKPFFGIDFTLAVNMKNEIDLIPDSSRNVKYPRKMTKFVEVSIEERKNPSKKEYTTLEVFASNRDEFCSHRDALPNNVGPFALCNCLFIKSYCHMIE